MIHGGILTGDRKESSHNDCYPPLNNKSLLVELKIMIASPIFNP